AAKPHSFAPGARAGVPCGHARRGAAGAVLGPPADEGVRADARELDQAADAANRRVLSDLRVTAHRDLGDDDGALADPRIVADMAGRHEQAVGPDLGEAFGPRRAMDGDVLANHRPRTDAHARDGGALELRVLGIGADDGAGTHAHAGAELDPALDDDVRPDLDVRRQLPPRAHDREGPDLHAGSQLGLRIDQRHVVDLLTHPWSAPPPVAPARAAAAASPGAGPGRPRSGKTRATGVHRCRRA